MKSLILAIVGGLILALAAHANAQEKKVTLDKLLNDLKSKDANVQVAALVEIAELGPKAEAAVRTLVPFLHHKNEDLRLNAALALGKIGAAAVEPLAQTLAGKDERARFYALSALGWIGPDAKSAAPAIFKLLSAKQDDVRQKAIFAIGRIKPDAEKAVPMLLERLGDADAEVREAATTAVAAYGAQAVPGLSEALGKSKSLNVQIHAANALGMIGADAKGALPALKALLGAADEKTAPAAADALAKIGKPSLPILKDALNDGQPLVRTLAVHALGKVGADAPPILLEALASKHVDVRREAVIVLGGMGISDKILVLRIAELLQDEKEEVRVSTATALGQMPMGAKFAGPALVDALRDKSADVRQAARVALQSSDVETAVVLPRLVKMLTDKSPAVRALAIDVLYPHGSAAAPHIIAALKDPAEEVRLAAVKGLESLAGDLSESVEAISALLDSDSEAIRETTCRVLARAGPKGMPHLVKACKDRSAKVRESTATMLRTLPPTKEAVSAMIAAIKDDDEKVRYHATWTLGVYGAEAKSATAPLIESLKKDKAYPVRENCAWSLGLISPDPKLAVPALQAALRDPQVSVQNYARNSLTQLQKK